MNLIKQTTNSLAALLYKIRKRDIVRLHNEFAARQWWDTRRILSESDNLTRKLAQHASLQVKYYKEVFQNLGLDSATMIFPDGWERLPILDKDILRQRYNDVISSSGYATNSYVNHTGGSTGSPVQFLTDLTVYQHMVAWLDLTFSWAGWQPGELRLNLWGGKECRLPPTFMDRVRASLSGGYTIPVYEYAEREIQQWWDVVTTMQPTIIYGYPSVLDDFAKWLDSEKLTPRGIKGIFSTAEVLYPKQRRIIERVFGCRVFNQYGSRETPCIASECPEGGMHIFCDMNRVEFVDSTSNPEDDKDIIVTPLYNYAQPLLRYQLGDMGKPKAGSCSCGRGYPLMELNLARSRDFILSQKGSKIYPGFFTRLMDGNNRVRSFQFIQKDISRLELNLEVTTTDGIDDYRQRLYLKLLPQIESKTGALDNFSINIVEEINRTRAGKHRFVVNEIDKEFT